jgi:hypothetical protein
MYKFSVSAAHSVSGYRFDILFIAITTLVTNDGRFVVALFLRWRRLDGLSSFDDIHLASLPVIFNSHFLFRRFAVTSSVSGVIYDVINAVMSVNQIVSVRRSVHDEKPAEDISFRLMRQMCHRFVDSCSS